MQARRDIFQAIADPNRRAIIDLISRQTLNLNAVADHFDISRPAVSKHIRILTECGVVVLKKKGRERFCTANTEKLKEVDRWLEAYRTFWNKKLDSLGDYLSNADDNIIQDTK